MIVVSSYQWTSKVGQTTFSQSSNIGTGPSQGAVMTSTTSRRSATFVRGTSTSTFDPSASRTTSSGTYRPSQTSLSAYCWTSSCVPASSNGVLWRSGQSGLISPSYATGSYNKSCISCISR